MNSNEKIMYLSTEDVRAACEEIDPLACVQETLCLHSAGRTTVPDEAYLAWSPAGGGEARSLNMPGLVNGDQPAVGTKIINANTANPGKGINRAHGLTLLFDIVTARPICIMEGAYISSLRTASVSVLSIQHLGRPPVRIASLLGAGMIAAQHARMLIQRVPGLMEIRIHDTIGERAESLCRALDPNASGLGVKLVSVAEPKDALAGADVVIPCTTTRQSYIERSWLAPGAVAVNVSLDDLAEEVLMTADRLYVDDWNLIRADQHRLLGRLARAGKVHAPRVGACAEGSRFVTGTLGDLFRGKCPGRVSDDDVIVVNPFGLSILDIAIARLVYQVAHQRQMGITLPT